MSALVNRELILRAYDETVERGDRTKLPVILVVLYLEPGEKPAPRPYELRVDDLLLAAWHYIAIELYRLPAQHLFALDRPGLLPLIPSSQCITIA